MSTRFLNDGVAIVSIDRSDVEGRPVRLAVSVCDGACEISLTTAGAAIVAEMLRDAVEEVKSEKKDE